MVSAPTSRIAANHTGAGSYSERTEFGLAKCIVIWQRKFLLVGIRDVQHLNVNSRLTVHASDSGKSVVRSTVFFDIPW